MHFQNREEQIVQFIFGDRLAGHHFDLALHRRVHHDCGACDFRDEFNQFLNICLFQVDRKILCQQMPRRQSQAEQQGKKCKANPAQG